MTSTEDKIKVMQAYLDGEPIEKALVEGSGWVKDENPKWNWLDLYYRVAARQDSIDWSHVHEDLKWMARDPWGDARLYKTRPKAKRYCWYDPCAISPILTHNFASYRRGNTPWDESLVKRPDTEDE